jgi:hypothetical protein
MKVSAKIPFTIQYNTHTHKKIKLKSKNRNRTKSGRRWSKGCKHTDNGTVQDRWQFSRPSYKFPKVSAIMGYPYPFKNEY